MDAYGYRRKDAGKPGFVEMFSRLRGQLEDQFAESARLEAAIRENLARLTRAE